MLNFISFIILIIHAFWLIQLYLTIKKESRKNVMGKKLNPEKCKQKILNLEKNKTQFVEK